MICQQNYATIHTLSYRVQPLQHWKVTYRHLWWVFWGFFVCIYDACDNEAPANPTSLVGTVTEINVTDY